MSTLSILAVYLTQFVAGWLVTSELSGTSSRKLARCIILGPALIAAQMFAYHLVGIPFSLITVLSPWWVLAALHWKEAARQFGNRSIERASGPVINRPLTVVVLIVFLGILWHSCTVPVYHGDEINNFAVNARVFEVHQNLAPETLKSFNGLGHPEYPPLIALNQALLFMAEGDLLGYAVKPFFALAWLAWALLVIELVGLRLTPVLGSLIALIGISIPEFAEFAVGGKGDLRLIVALMLVIMEARNWLLQPPQSNSMRAFLAFGIAALACALTKNEGLALATLGILALLPVALRRFGTVRAILAALACLVSFWAWPAFKSYHGIHDVYLGEADLSANLHRLDEILIALTWFHAGSIDEAIARWGTFGIALGVALISGLFSGRIKLEARLVFIGLAIHFALYVAVFVATPRDLAWHLETAGPRLILHLVPWLMLLMVACLAPVERNDTTKI